MTSIEARNKRVGLHLPLNVSGRDVLGAPFAEATRTVNVSGGGLCFETRQKLGIGSRITLHIEVPEPMRRHFRGQAVYRVRAVVCRVERFEGQALARLGARFVAEIDD